MVPQGPNWNLENSPLRESIWVSAGALLSVATTSYCMGGGGGGGSTKTKVSIIRASSLSLKVSRTILGYMDIFQREIVHLFRSGYAFLGPASGRNSVQNEKPERTAQLPFSERCAVCGDQSPSSQSGSGEYVHTSDYSVTSFQNTGRSKEETWEVTTPGLIIHRGGSS